MEDRVIENGVYLLSGVGSNMFTDSYGNDINVQTLCLDGIVYGAYEDPCDGWRSYGGFTTDENITSGKCQYMFDPQKVVVTNKVIKEYNDDGCCYKDSGFVEITDFTNGKLIMKIGTDNTDDYYPICVYEYYPQNLYINQDKCEHEEASDKRNYCPILYGAISEEKRTNLLKELEALYNRLGIDVELNMHDFVLAENTLNYLITLGNIERAETDLQN